MYGPFRIVKTEAEAEKLREQGMTAMTPKQYWRGAAIVFGILAALILVRNLVHLAL